MGGVKNRDAKRAAAKVFSSGGGGGSKGPSVIDKRGQEEQCPHCDRVFKQNSRLKEHIARQHADQLQQEQVPTASEGSASKQLVRPVAADPPASKCPQVGCVAPGRPGPSGGSGTTRAGVGPTAAGSSTGSGSSTGMFDVGSRGGFYTEKAPRLMLHEWCTQQKRPKPKYKAVPVDPEKGGGFRARVVLPDAKLPGSDKDIVVWLDADHATEQEDEALQRGAVAALQAIAGERSLDYVLPQRYRQLWKDIGNKAAERAEAQRRAAAAAAERRARSARSQDPSRAPMAVVMSDKQRQAVESLMQELDLDACDSSVPGNKSSEPLKATVADSGLDSEVQFRQGVVVALIKAGFSLSDSTAAVQAVGTAAGQAAAAAAVAATATAAAGGRGHTRVWRSHDGLQPYLDWLCLQLPVERLPARYRPGGSSGAVGILRTNNSSSSNNGSQRNLSHATAIDDDAEGLNDSASWQHDPAVQQLVSYGYPPQHAMDALRLCGGSLVRALHYLQQQLITGSSAVDLSVVESVIYVTSPSSSADKGDDSDVELPHAWLDELEVLSAIYDQQLQCSTPGMLTLAVDVSEMVGESAILQLHVWCPSQPAPYPDTAPLIALSCRLLSGSMLLQLTARLAATAHKFVGDPVVHELAVQLGEDVQALAGQGSQAASGWPPPFNQPMLSSPVSGNFSVIDDNSATDDGYTDQAEQHAAAAEAIMGGDKTGPIAAEQVPHQRKRQQRTALSREQAARESRRLQDHYDKLQRDASYASMKATRSRLPAFSCRDDVLKRVSSNHVVVISGATGCGKSTQVPQYLLEEAVSSGAGGNVNIIVCQPRRIAAVGLATRVADEVGDPAGVGGLVGYSVRLDSKCSQQTRLLFCTTGVLLRRLMSDPQLEGVTHVVLDEVHERNMESDLLLLLLRRALLAALVESSSGAPPPKVLLMSATADAKLFVNYFQQAGPAALLQGQQTQLGNGKHHQECPQLSVSTLSIPGFTHPVKQLWLEDALQVTGIRIGKTSRYAKQKKPRLDTCAANRVINEDYEEDGEDAADVKYDYELGLKQTQCKQSDPQPRMPSSTTVGKLSPSVSQVASSANSERKVDALGGNSDAGFSLGSDAPCGEYTEEVLKSVHMVDPSIINYELIEALLVQIASGHQKHGFGGMLQDPTPPPIITKAAVADAGSPDPGPGAVLIFMPGAPEIDRLVRQLQSSPKLAATARKGLRILPLHGGLPPSTQSRVFERPPRGMLKIVVATNVAETSLTIDDVTVVIDTGRHKEMSFDASRGLSCLKETWVSQAAAQQRRGRAGRVAPGVCYRLYPGHLWHRLAPQQPPEVLRVPLQQLCLTTMAALAAATPGACDIKGVLALLLTPPRHDSIEEAVTHLVQMGAIGRSPIALTPLGQHLAAMPMDAALGKSLIYGCMLRCASPMLTVAAALAHGRPLWISPPLDKRAEANTARQALAPQAFTQRSDHLALVSIFNGWLATKASDGRRAASDFAKQLFVSEQVLEAIAQGRLDFASTLAQRGFLPEWYPSHLRHLQSLKCAQSQGSTDDVHAQAYGAVAVKCGAPDEYSHNARVLKSAICAGFYPRILRVEAPIKYQQVHGGAIRVEAQPSSIKFFERNLGRVWIHPSSVCFTAGSYSSGWLVFTQLLETSRPYVRESSMVPLYALLTFGGELEVLHDQGLLLLDGWAKFKAPARVGVLIKRLRYAVAQLLAAKISNPTFDVSEQKVIGALHQLLATDGF